MGITAPWEGYKTCARLRCPACGVFTALPVGHWAFFRYVGTNIQPSLLPSSSADLFVCLHCSPEAAVHNSTSPEQNASCAVVQQCQHELHLWQKTHLGAKKKYVSLAKQPRGKPGPSACSALRRCFSLKLAPVCRYLPRGSSQSTLNLC